MEYFLFVVGFIILVKGADWLIKGSSALARFFGMSEWLIGLTIVGIGTSLPELGITISSAISKNAEIGVGTVVGSNTFNILFIIGLAAILSPLTIDKLWVRRDFILNFLAVCIAFILAAISINSTSLTISRVEGAVLLSLFIGWLLYNVYRSRSTSNVAPSENKSTVLPISFLLIIVGLAGVVFGAQWVIQGAVAIADYFDASSGFIGLTLVSLGTSLPELVVSVTAALRKNFAMSVGNIVGSNVFDFFGILGLASLLSPIDVPGYLAADFAVTIMACLMLISFMFIGQKYTLTRFKGAVYIVCYISYGIFLFYRG